MKTTQQPSPDSKDTGTKGAVKQAVLTGTERAIKQAVLRACEESVEGGGHHTEESLLKRISRLETELIRSKMMLLEAAELGFVSSTN